MEREKEALIENRRIFDDLKGAKGHKSGTRLHSGFERASAGGGEKVGENEQIRAALAAFFHASDS